MTFFSTSAPTWAPTPSLQVRPSAQPWWHSEPGEAFEWLVRNFALNHLGTAQARREAVGAACGIVSFTSGLDTVNRIDRQGAATVPLTTLDAACDSRAP